MGAEQSRQPERRRDFERNEIKLRNLIEKCAGLDAKHVDSLVYHKSDDFLNIMYEQVMFPVPSSSLKPFDKYRVMTVYYQPHIDSQISSSYGHLTGVFCETDYDSISSSSYMRIVDEYLAQQELYMSKIEQDEQKSKMLLRIYLAVAAANKKFKEHEKSCSPVDHRNSSPDCCRKESSTDTASGATLALSHPSCPKANDTTEVLLISSVQIFSMLTNSIAPTSVEAVEILDNLIDALINQIDDVKFCDANTAIDAVKPPNIVNEYVFQRMFEIIADKYLVAGAHVGNKAISLLLVLAITEKNAYSVLKVIKLMLAGPYQLEPSVCRLCSKFDATVLTRNYGALDAGVDIPPPIAENSIKYEDNMPNAHLFIMQTLPFAYRKKSLRINNNDVDSSVNLLLEFVVNFLKQENGDSVTISCIESCLVFTSLILQSRHEYILPTLPYPKSFVIGDLVQRGDSWKENNEDKLSNPSGVGTVIGLTSTGEVTVRWKESGLLCYYHYSNSTCRTVKCVQCIDKSKRMSLTSTATDVLKALFLESLHSKDAIGSDAKVHIDGVCDDKTFNKLLLKAVSNTLAEVIILNIDVLYPKNSIDSYALITLLLDMFGSNTLGELFKPILLSKMSAIKSSDVIALFNNRVSEDSMGAMDSSTCESLAHDCLKYLKTRFLAPFHCTPSDPVTADQCEVQVLEIGDYCISNSTDPSIGPVFVASNDSDVQLTDDNSFATFNKKHAYVTCPVEMINDNGYWEWELENVHDRFGDEVSAVGVAKLPIINPQHSSSPEIWCVRCYEGKTHHNGTTTGRHHVGARPLSKINVGDLCKFFYNTYTQELSLKVKKKSNEDYTDCGIIFDSLPSGISPYVGDYGSVRNSKWKLHSLSHFPSPIATSSDVEELNVSDKLLQGQVYRLLDSITIKLILHEVDSIMNHYYTTADYSPTAVYVNDSDNNVVTTWRQPSALPRGANGETIETVVDRISAVIFPLLDSLHECLEALADPTKRDVILRNPIVKKNLSHFEIGFVSSGVVALLKLILLQFPLVYNLHQEVFRPIFDKLSRISTSLFNIRHFIKSVFFQNLFDEIQAIHIVTIGNCMSHTVRMRGHQRWLKSPLFFHSYASRSDLKALEVYLKQNLIESRSTASDNIIQKLKEHSRKSRPPVQVQGSCMDTYVFATWAALMYHDESVELFQSGSLDETNRIIRTWSLANSTVRAHIGKHLNTPTEGSVKMEILQRATFLLKFEPVRDNDQLIIEFILQGPKYEDINSLVYENSIACSLRLKALTSTLQMYSEINAFTSYIPFILRAAMAEHQSGRNHSRGVEVNYTNNLSGMSKHMHKNLTDAHHQLLGHLINVSIEHLKSIAMGNLDSAESKVMVFVVMGTLTLLLQDFSASDILSLANSNILTLFQLCISIQHAQLSVLASKVMELYCINLSKLKYDDSLCTNTTAVSINPLLFYETVLKLLDASLAEYVEQFAHVNNLINNGVNKLANDTSADGSVSRGTTVVSNNLVYASMEESGYTWTHPNRGESINGCNIPMIHSLSFYVCLHSSDGLITSTGPVTMNADPWDAISVGIVKNKFVVRIADFKVPFTATSKSCVTLNTWTHFAYVVNGKDNAIDLYINGCLDVSVPLSPTLCAESVIRTITDHAMESEHPYQDNACDWYTVDIPGAIKYSVTFDARTKTESSCDHIIFYEGHDKKKQVGDKFSGGHNNRDQCFPGLNGRPALEINCPMFQFNFVSDGNTHDWGWKCNIEAVTVQVKSTSMSQKALEMPHIHIGKVADGNSSITGFITGAALGHKDPSSDALETDHAFGHSASVCKALNDFYTDSSWKNSADYYKWSLKSIAATISIVTAIASNDKYSSFLEEILRGSKLLDTLYTLILHAPSSTVRLSSAKLVSLLTKIAPIDLIQRRFCQSILCRESLVHDNTLQFDNSFMTQALKYIGDSTNLFKRLAKSQCVVMPHHHLKPSLFVNETISRRLMQSLVERWYMSDSTAVDFIFLKLKEAIAQLVEELHSNNVTSDACDFYHGLVTTIFPCSVYNQLLLPGTVVMCGNKLLGEQVVLCDDNSLHKGTGVDVNEPIPLTMSCIGVSSGASSSHNLLVSSTCDDYWVSSGSKPHWIKISVPNNSCWACVQLYLHDWGSYSPEKLRLSLGDKVIKSGFRVPQSDRHGWFTVLDAHEVPEDTTDLEFNNIKIEILENYEGGCDSKVASVRLLSGGSKHRNVVLSPLKLSEVYGKLHMNARMEDIVPSEVPDKECHAVTTKILTDDQLIDTMLPLLSMSTYDKRNYIAETSNRCASSIIVETSHPYLDNMDQYWDVELKDADFMLVSFDGLCQTEHSNHYVQFFSDRSKSTQYGTGKYSGAAGAKNWPSEPLKIAASKCVVYFHSDRSETDWGFRVSIKGIKTTLITDDLYVRPEDLSLLQRRYFKSEALDMAKVILNRRECHQGLSTLLPFLVDALIAPMIATSADTDYLYAAINGEDKDATTITSINHFRCNVSSVCRNIQQKLHRIFTTMKEAKKPSVVVTTRSTYKPARKLWFNAAGYAMGLGCNKGKGKFYCGRNLGVTIIPGSDGNCGPSNGPQCPDCLAFVPMNSAGAVMKPGPNDRLYCSRKLGRDAIPGSDGQCGPNNGPQCNECRLFQSLEMVRDRSILPISEQDFVALVAREADETSAPSISDQPVDLGPEIIGSATSNVIQPDSEEIIRQQYANIMSIFSRDINMISLAESSAESFITAAETEVSSTNDTKDIAEEKISDEFIMCEEELFLLAIDDASRDEQLIAASPELIAKLSPAMRERALALQHKGDKKSPPAKKTVALASTLVASIVIRKTNHTSLRCGCNGGVGTIPWPLNADILHKDDCVWDCCEAKWSSETCSKGGGYITRYHPEHTLLKTTGHRCHTARCDICNATGVSAYFCGNCDFDVCKPCLGKEKSRVEFIAQWDESAVSLYTSLCSDLFANESASGSEAHPLSSQLLPDVRSKKCKIEKSTIDDRNNSVAVLTEEFECLVRCKTHDLLCEVLRQYGTARVRITKNMYSMFVMVTRLAMIEYNHGSLKLMHDTLSCFQGMLQSNHAATVELLEHLIYWNTVSLESTTTTDASVVTSLLTSRLPEVALFSVNLLISKLSDDLKTCGDKGALATSFFNSHTGTIVLHSLQKFSNYFDPKMNKTRAGVCGLCSWCTYGKGNLACAKRSMIKYGVGIIHGIFTILEHYVVVDMLNPAVSPQIVGIAKRFSVFCQFNLSVNQQDYDNEEHASFFTEEHASFFTELGATVQQILTKMTLIQLKQTYLYPRYNFRRKIPVIVSTGKNLIKNASATGCYMGGASDALVSRQSIALGSDVVGFPITTYSFHIKIAGATCVAYNKCDADEWELINRTSKLTYINVVKKKLATASSSRNKHRGVFRDTNSDLEQYCSLPDQPEGPICTHPGGIICRSHWSCCGVDLRSSRYCSIVSRDRDRSANGDDTVHSMIQSILADGNNSDDDCDNDDDDDDDDDDDNNDHDDDEDEDDDDDDEDHENDHDEEQSHDEEHSHDDDDDDDDDNNDDDDDDDGDDDGDDDDDNDDDGDDDDDDEESGHDNDGEESNGDEDDEERSFDDVRRRGSFANQIISRASEIIDQTTPNGSRASDDEEHSHDDDDESYVAAFQPEDEEQNHDDRFVNQIISKASEIIDQATPNEGHIGEEINLSKDAIKHSVGKVKPTSALKAEWSSNNKIIKIPNGELLSPDDTNPSSSAGVMNIGMCDFSNSNVDLSVYSLPCFSFGYSSDGKLFCNSTIVSNKAPSFESDDIIGIHVTFGPTNRSDNTKKMTWLVSKNHSIVSEPIDCYVDSDLMVRPAFSLSNSSQSAEFISPQNQVIFPHMCVPQYISPFTKPSNLITDMTAMYQSVYVRHLMRMLIYKSDICEYNYEDFSHLCSNELSRVIKNSSLAIPSTVSIDCAVGYRISVHVLDSCRDKCTSGGSLIVECVDATTVLKGSEPAVPVRLCIPLTSISKDSTPMDDSDEQQDNYCVAYDKSSLIQFESMQFSDVVHVGAKVTRGPHWSTASAMKGVDTDFDGGAGSIGIITGVKVDVNKVFKPIKVLTVKWKSTNNVGKYIWGGGLYEVVVIEPCSDPLRSVNHPNYLFASTLNVYIEGDHDPAVESFEVNVSPIFLAQDLLHHSNFLSLRKKYEDKFRLSDDEINAIGRCIDDFHTMNLSSRSSRKSAKNIYSMHKIAFENLVTSRDKEAKDCATGTIPNSSARYFTHMDSQGYTKIHPSTIETGHPYEHNMDQYWDVAFDDIDYMLIEFDEKSATEEPHDYVSVLSDKKKTKVYGKYSGSTGNRWPGVGGKAPLKVKASKCVVYFHSDDSTNDWGFKVTITGVKEGKHRHYMDIDNYPELKYLRYDSRSFNSYYHLIIDLKVHLIKLLKSINLQESSISGSLSWMILRLRHIIPTATRMSIINKALEKSTTKAKSFEIKIDRVSANRHIDRGEVDNDGQWSVFSQMFRVLTSRPVSDLCSNDRCFKIDLGEGAIDGGGPYREVWTNLAEDLMSSYLPLLVPSPNQRTRTGENQEKWALNPLCNSAVQLQMLGFLGKLMGMAIRSHNYLEIELSQVCWKLIAGEHVSMRDFQQHDEQLISSIYLIDAADNMESLADCFGDSVQYFTTVSSLTTTAVELHPEGASTIVTMENKHRYVEELQKFISEEMSVVASTIRAGIASIIPPISLYLMSGGELEMQVCGDPRIDLKVLKARTKLDGWSSSDPLKEYFWSMLEEFSPKELSMLVRFSWGRSRLPKKSDYEWKVTKLDCSNYDQRLPEAHTCFFQICIPPYSTREIAAEKIKYAIHSIDMSMR